jgi:heterodisulfide reductase subunit C
MFAIRNIAAAQNNVPEGLIEQARSLVSTGQVVPLTHLATEKRKELGLPQLEVVSPKVIQKLLKDTRLSSVV